MVLLSNEELPFVDPTFNDLTASLDFLFAKVDGFCRLIDEEGGGIGGINYGGGFGQFLDDCVQLFEIGNEFVF